MGHWVVQHLTHNDVALGEVIPLNPQANWILKEPSTLTYEIDRYHHFNNPDFTKPYATDFKLLRDGVPLMGGMHTEAEAGTDPNNLEVAAKDWVHYLEKVPYPFDPDTPTAFVRAATDVYTIMTDLLNDILAQPGTPDFSYSFGTLGKTANLRVELGDTESIFEKIRQFSEERDSFDFDITPDRTIRVFAPQKMTESKFIVQEGKNLVELKCRFSGIVASRVTGLGAGSASRLAKRIANQAAIDEFRLLEVAQDFGEVSDANVLQRLTEGQLDRDSTPIEVVTAQIVGSDEFWDEVEIGDKINIEANIGYRNLQIQQRLVSYDLAIDDNDQEIISLSFDDSTIPLSP